MSAIDPMAPGTSDEWYAPCSVLGLTVFMVTHDLDSLYACDRIAVLRNG